MNDLLLCVCVVLLRSYGDAVHCRKALHRAVQCTSDYPEHVCEVLLTFERVEGKFCFSYLLQTNCSPRIFILMKPVGVNMVCIHSQATVLGIRLILTLYQRR